MEKNLYIDASHPNETRIVLKSNSSIEEYEHEDKNNLNFKNNIYLATIAGLNRPGSICQFGRERHAFLAFNDIQSDYYQIPSEDKEKLDRRRKIREELKDNAVEANQDNQQIENISDKEINKEEKILTNDEQSDSLKKIITAKK